MVGREKDNAGISSHKNLLGAHVVLPIQSKNTTTSVSDTAFPSVKSRL